MSYTFVDSDLHNARKLLSLVGSFWSDIFQGMDQVQTYCGDVGEVAYQASIDLAETINSVGRATVPVYHTEQWYVYNLLESQQGIAPVLYGGPGSGSFGGSLVYGASSGGAPVYSWSCPVANVDLIFNRIYDPSATLTRGVDFMITGGRLVFFTNPFTDPRFAVSPVMDNTGAVIDRQIAVWLFRSAIDQDVIWTQFGYIMGIRLSSSPEYKELVNALLDAITSCTATDQLNGMLAAVTDCAFARGNEVVEDIVTSGDTLLVITDQWAYRFPTTATPVVQIGDQIEEGDALVDTVETWYLNHGVVPDWLSALSIGEGLLMPGYMSELTFGNVDTPLVVELNVDGYTKVSWALSGFPADVTEFWDNTHARGVASGTTMAHLLDVRANPIGEPTAASLPATINPLEFLATNYLRHNALLVRINAGGFGPNALGLSQLRHLRRIVPPHEAVLIVIEMPVVKDSATLDLIAEDLLSFSAAEPVHEPVDPDRLGDGPSTASIVLGTCYGST